MKAHFLEAFERLREEGADHIKLYGDIILVERLPQEEAKSAGGIIMATHDRQRNGFGENLPAFYVVLYVGEGYYDDETNETVPLDVQPGDVIMTGTQSVREISKFGPLISTKDHTLGLSRVEEIQIRFPRGSFEKVGEILKMANTSQNDLVSPVIGNAAQC